MAQLVARQIVALEVVRSKLTGVSRHFADRVCEHNINAAGRDSFFKTRKRPKNAIRCFYSAVHVQYC